MHYSLLGKENGFANTVFPLLSYNSVLSVHFDIISGAATRVERFPTIYSVSECNMKNNNNLTFSRDVPQSSCQKSIVEEKKHQLYFALKKKDTTSITGVPFANELATYAASDNYTGLWTSLVLRP